MLTNQRQLSCGNCGYKDFSVFTSNKNMEINIQCKKCKGVTAIRPKKPELELHWGTEDTDGILCHLDT